jgi:hypothetical protein
VKIEKCSLAFDLAKMSQTRRLDQTHDRRGPLPQAICLKLERDNDLHYALEEVIAVAVASTSFITPWSRP